MHFNNKKNNKSFQNRIKNGQVIVKTQQLKNYFLNDQLIVIMKFIINIDKNNRMK